MRRWSFSNCVNITRHCWNDVQINIKTIKKIMMILCSCPDRVSWVIHIKKKLQINHRYLCSLRHLIRGARTKYLTNQHVDNLLTKLKFFDKDWQVFKSLTIVDQLANTLWCVISKVEWSTNIMTKPALSDECDDGNKHCIMDVLIMITLSKLWWSWRFWRLWWFWFWLHKHQQSWMVCKHFDEADVCRRLQF